MVYPHLLNRRENISTPPIVHKKIAFTSTYSRVETSKYRTFVTTTPNATPTTQGNIYPTQGVKNAILINFTAECIYLFLKIAQVKEYFEDEFNRLK